MHLCLTVGCIASGLQFLQHCLSVFQSMSFNLIGSHPPACVLCSMLLPLLWILVDPCGSLWIHAYFRLASGLCTVQSVTLGLICTTPSMIGTACPWEYES